MIMTVQQMQINTTGVYRICTLHSDMHIALYVQYLRTATHTIFNKIALKGTVVLERVHFVMSLYILR